MQRLEQTIQTVFRVDEKGGRLIQRDNNTIMLYDYSFIANGAIQLILNQFPHADVTTHSCSSSSSGFVVMFTYMDMGSQWLRSETMQMVLLLLTVVIVGNSYLLECVRA